jgi:hypothetical protein
VVVVCRPVVLPAGGGEGEVLYIDGHRRERERCCVVNNNDW